MTDFKNKIHYLIKEQLPEYVAAQYPLYVTFLEKYYEFLESSSQAHEVLLNATSWNDIDKTLDIFIPAFRKQLAVDFPQDTLVKTRRLLKYIHNFYETKGSENATELFFRFLYNETVSVAYPGDYILRASDGKWRKNCTLKLELRAGKNAFDLRNKTFELKYVERIPGVGRIKRSVSTSCLNVVGQIEAGIYQLEVDNSLADYVFPDVTEVPRVQDILGGNDKTVIPSLGDYDTFIYVVYDGAIYGSLSKQIVQVESIDVAGGNFKIDDSYIIGEEGLGGPYFAQLGNLGYVNDPLGAYTEDGTTLNQAIIRVKEVTKPLKGIDQIQLVTTGQRFLARQRESVTTPYFEWDVPSSSYVQDPLNPSIGANTYAFDTEDAIPINTFTVQITPRAPRNVTGSPATIVFRTGVLYQEPGAFKDSAGFLSDINKIQDNYYYQPYSYVIRTQQPIDKWRDVYLKTAHPAGFKLFAELQFVDSLTVDVSVVDDFEVLNNFTGRHLILNLSTAIYFAENYVSDIAQYCELGDRVLLSDSIATIKS